MDEKHNWLGKFWENFENFWWKFNRKIEILSILEKIVAKNRSFGNNIIFYNQFFSGSGEVGLNPPNPPCGTPLTSGPKLWWLWGGKIPPSQIIKNLKINKYLHQISDNLYECSSKSIYMAIIKDMADENPKIKFQFFLGLGTQVNFLPKFGGWRLRVCISHWTLSVSQTKNCRIFALIWKLMDFVKQHMHYHCVAPCM